MPFSRDQNSNFLYWGEKQYLIGSLRKILHYGSNLWTVWGTLIFPKKILKAYSVLSSRKLTPLSIFCYSVTSSNFPPKPFLSSHWILEMDLWRYLIFSSYFINEETKAQSLRPAQGDRSRHKTLPLHFESVLIFLLDFDFGITLGDSYSFVTSKP